MKSLLFAKRDLGDPGDLLVPSRATSRGTAGQRVDWETSLTIPGVWSAVQLRASILSTLPVDVFLRRPGSGVPQAMATPTILTTPSGNGLDITDWLFASQVSLDLRGNAFGQVLDRDGFGYPTQIELVHPDKVTIRKRFDGAYVYRINGTRVPTEDVWHERAFVAPGSIVGLSPIKYAATTMGVALAAEEYGADWFGTGSHPSSILTNPDLEELEEDDAATVKERFIGSVSRNEPAVLSGGWKYQAIQLSPGEAQFIETQRWTLNQVARLFGVPPEMIGGEAGNSLTYANVEQRGLDFTAFNIGPTIFRRERALSKLVPRAQFVKLNEGALLRTDLLTRYRAYSIAVKAQFLHPDEAREKEDLPPLTAAQKEDLAEMVHPPSGSNGEGDLPAEDPGAKVH